MTKKSMQIMRSSAAEYLIFVAASGQNDVNAIYADEDVWLSQKMMGVLYDVSTQTINYHLKKAFDDSELDERAVIRKFRITATDGKTYETNHYNLAAIIAVLELAESMATRRIPMTMEDWASRLDAMLQITGRDVLRDAGKVSAATAKSHAESEFEKYRIQQDREFRSDFDRYLEEVQLGLSKGGHDEQD